MNKLKRLTYHITQWFKPSTETPVGAGEAQTMKQSNEPTQTVEPLSYYSSIKDLPLRHFIACSCYDDFTVLAKNRTELTEIEAEIMGVVWMRLMSEYYEAREDKHVSNYLAIVSKMEYIKWRANYITSLLDAISEVYVPEIADILRGEFKQMKWSADSYKGDITFAINLEKRNVHEYNQLKAQFDLLEKEKPGAKQTPEQKYKGFTQMLFDINKVEGAGTANRDMMTYDFAVATLRLEQHYESQKKQHQTI